MPSALRLLPGLIVCLLIGSILLVAPIGVGSSLSAASVAAASLRLGKVDFPTSGSPAARPHFERGVAALHSFWYEEALEAFEAALRIDSGFAMAWWGVAMCYHRPFVPGSDDEAGRRALARIGNTSALTARERSFIDALRAWYRAGPAPSRARDYAAAMKKVHLAYPEDLEAAAFYALSLLGPAWGEEEYSSRHATAGGIAEDVYRRNPNHPGAAHYLIHSFDEPELASRALTAARHYAGIAPDAPHAQHMPSHIFLQLGMWNETTISNETAWSASEAWVRRKGLGPASRDYHNLHWLIYSCLQQGRYAKAAELINGFRGMRKDMSPEGVQFFNQAAAAFVVETRRWDRADALFSPGASDQPDPATARSGPPQGVELCGGGPQPADIPAFMRALAAAILGAPDADKRLNDLHVLAGGNLIPDFWRVRVLAVGAVSNARDGAFDAAIAALRQATAIEEELGRPPGPPMAYKPPHELLGEILLRAGRPAEALVEFRKNLARHPNRALSLLGCARAGAAMGDRPGALASYGRLLEVWDQADKDLPELPEARDYVQADQK